MKDNEHEMEIRSKIASCLCTPETPQTQHRHFTASALFLSNSHLLFSTTKANAEKGKISSTKEQEENVLSSSYPLYVFQCLCLWWFSHTTNRTHIDIPWAPEKTEASEHEGIHHSDSPRERAEMNMAADEEGSNAREQKTSFLSQLFCLLCCRDSHSYQRRCRRWTRADPNNWIKKLVCRVWILVLK